MTIEGIPDGWELVRIGRPMRGEFRVDAIGKPKAVTDNQICAMDCPIIRKIEKPKRYRPFENAAEFEPFMDRWICHRSNSDSCMRIDGYGNKGVTIQGNAHDFSRLFDDRIFDDGTPFGIEVTECK